MNKLKQSFKTTHSRNGAYSISMIGVVIAIIVVLNLIVGKLPEKYRKLDVSDNKIYEITDTSRSLLKKLDKKVELKVLADEKDVDKRIHTFIGKYAALSKNVSVEWVDPVLHPSVLSENDAQSDTILVSCKDTNKSTQIAFSDIIQYDMSSYYTTGTAQESAFDGEGQLTSAINYVTNDVDKKVYRTAGHGEASLGSGLTEMMEKSNLSTEELNLVMSPSVPEDCDLLILNGPEKDISEEEKDALSAYLSKGGNVMLFLGASEEKLPNLEALMKEYGLALEEGYIADMSRCYQNNYYYIFPQLSVTGDLAKGLSSEMVMAINSKGMTETDPARDSITVDAFMKTSSDGYAVTETAQKQGTYIIGATATETISGSGDADSEDADSEDTDSAGAEARFTVFGTNSIMDSSITQTFPTLDNMTLVMNAMTGGLSDVQNVSIEAKSLGVSYNTVKHADAFSLLVIFGIPLAVVGAGMYVWMKRRKA